MVRKALREQLGKKYCLEEVNKNSVFNHIYHLITSLAFVPAEDMVSVFSDVIDPLVDESRAVLSDNAHDYVDYFTATYIGCLSKQTNTRRPAKIKAERWSQYHNLMADKPHTNNSVEGFKSA